MKELRRELLEIKAMIEQGNLVNKKILSLKEAAFYTKLSESKLYKMSSNQEIAVSKPEGKLFFLRENLDKYMLSNYIPCKDEIRNNTKVFFNKKGRRDAR